MAFPRCGRRRWWWRVGWGRGGGKREEGKGGTEGEEGRRSNVWGADGGRRSMYLVPLVSHLPGARNNPNISPIYLSRHRLNTRSSPFPLSFRGGGSQPHDTALNRRSLFSLSSFPEEDTTRSNQTKQTNQEAHRGGLVSLQSSEEAKESAGKRNQAARLLERRKTCSRPRHCFLTSFVSAAQRGAFSPS